MALTIISLAEMWENGGADWTIETKASDDLPWRGLQR